jgi:hypothetical protein
MADTELINIVSDKVQEEKLLEDKKRNFIEQC